MLQTALIFIVFSFLVGGVIGYYFRLLVSLQRKETLDLDIKKAAFAAKEKASAIIAEAEKQTKKYENEVKKLLQERETAAQRKEERLIKKEELLDERQMYLDKSETKLQEKANQVDELRTNYENEQKKIEENLERVSNLSRDEAQKELIRVTEEQHEEDILVRLHKLEKNGLERLQQKAQEILVTAIHRLGNSVASDVMSTTVNIPNEEAKGKIIGKEGRNIRTFEKTAGVELIIDETPGSITISAFDPVRRHIAKNALERLIDDGRIQPAKIEKRLEEAQNEVDKTIKQKGEEAAYECGVFGLDEQVLSILGRLHFRTSYGQNVLQHSIEMAHIAGMLAEELGADISVAKTGALVHDIGKAVDHNVQGTHVEIGRRMLRKHNTDERIIKAMQAHHEEYPYETLESIIVQVADAISGGRPGARRDSLENYLKRLADLEALANSFQGVERCYALQAGREIRVFVEPNNISDIEAQKLARELALSIEKELEYPGEIKISVMRENRYTEYAR